MRSSLEWFRGDMHIKTQCSHDSSIIISKLSLAPRPDVIEASHQKVDHGVQDRASTSTYPFDAPACNIGLHNVSSSDFLSSAEIANLWYWRRHQRNSPHHTKSSTILSAMWSRNNSRNLYVQFYQISQNSLGHLLQFHHTYDIQAYISFNLQQVLILSASGTST